MDMTAPTHGNLHEVYRELGADNARRVRLADERMAKQGGFNAEIVEGVAAKWYVLTTAANQERIAAAHLIGRRFGVYLPETEETIVTRGRKRDVRRLLFRGYLFLFVWDIDRHLRRIRACPGVMGILCREGQPAVLPDAAIDDIRQYENSERPLALSVEAVAAPSKKKKKRWRRSRKPADDAVPSRDNDIVDVRAWGFRFDENLVSPIEETRRSALHRALGLAEGLEAWKTSNTP